MNRLSSSVLHLAAAAAIATSGDVLAKNDTTTARVVNTKSPEYVNVTEATRKRIADLQKNFPQFKIEDEVLSCIKGELIDAECEPTVAAVADAGENMIKIEATRKELEQKKNELLEKDKILDKENQELMVKKSELLEKDKALDEKDKVLDKLLAIGDNLTITTGLIQLGLYIDYNQIPSSEMDAMNKVTSNEKTPEEVLKLFTEYLDHKKNGGIFTWRTHGERLMSLANKYLNIAIQLEPEIQDTRMKVNAAGQIQTVAQFYQNSIKMLNKNDNPIVAIK